MSRLTMCLLLAVLLTLASSRSYPLYKQCDAAWGKDQLGTSSNTICSAGCLMSSASMALAGTGHSYNPGTLNAWLKGHGGYVSGDLFVWSAISALGLTFEGKVANSQIKAKLDAGKVVLCNVHNGGHWVLAHSYSGEDILVNDPGYSTTSYALSAIVDGQNGIYRVGNGLFNLVQEPIWMADGVIKSGIEELGQWRQLNQDETIEHKQSNKRPLSIMIQ